MTKKTDTGYFFRGRPARAKAVSTCGATLWLAAKRRHPFLLASRQEENIQSVFPVSLYVERSGWLINSFRILSPRQAPVMVNSYLKSKVSKSASITGSPECSLARAARSEEYSKPVQ
jgi:hypothetical protein